MEITQDSQIYKQNHIGYTIVVKSHKRVLRRKDIDDTFFEHFKIYYTKKVDVDDDIYIIDGSDIKPKLINRKYLIDFLKSYDIIGFIEGDCLDKDPHFFTSKIRKIYDLVNQSSY